MTTFDQLQDEVILTLSSYGLSLPRITHLATAIDADDLTLTVGSVERMDQGLLEIDSELLFVESVDRASNTLTIAPWGRGQFGSTAAAHDANAKVTSAPTWPRQRVKTAINHTITSTHPTLFGVAQTQFTFNPSVSTYELPAAAERILKVEADTYGASQEQQVVRRYSFNSVSPTDDWATTASISLHEGVSPGVTVTVTYVTQPTELEDGDAFTASGLRESAKKAILYGACAELVSFMDVARLPVDSAVGDEYAERNQIGMASRIAGQLTALYEAELEKERQRLRATTPVTISRKMR